MTMSHFKVIRPGINTTFQDLGRKNLYHFGIPFSGAMDNRNYLLSNAIAGMPFLGDINSNIRLNRLETPRVKVPKGSVGITEQFCNIYTFESPGGWNIIGNTPIKIFDKSNEKNPVIINPGDRVIFYEINKDQYLEFNG